MKDLRRLIHSPHHLFVFEVCGRLLSFTRAAEELGVSQPAVSLAIRQLEDALGFALFHRQHRRISLTESGERLYGEVSSSLSRVSQTIRELKRLQPSGLVTLSVSTAYANYWVMPRLGSLRQAHPGIDLRLQVVDRDSDLEDENVSLGIRRGRGRWSGYLSTCIAHEELYAVASPSYLDKHPMALSTDELARQSLIHLEEPYRPRPTWQNWFDAMGTQYEDSGEGLRLNDYALVLQAAIAGEGIALGWRHVVESLFGAGLLKPAYAGSWVTGEEFHLIWSEKTHLSEPAQQVRDWIIEESGRAA